MGGRRRPWPLGSTRGMAVPRALLALLLTAASVVHLGERGGAAGQRGAWRWSSPSPPPRLGWGGEVTNLAGRPDPLVLSPAPPGAGVTACSPGRETEARVGGVGGAGITSKPGGWA